MVFDLSARFSAAIGIFAGVFLVTPALAATQEAATPVASVSQAPKVFAKAYGNWLYRCQQVTVSGKAPVTQCMVMQHMVLNQNGHALPLITLALAKIDRQGAYILNAEAPLGILLSPGVAFWSDDNSPVTVALDFCEANGCLALRKPAEGLDAEFKTGKQGHAKFVLVNGRAVTIDFSLNGFGAALAALNAGTLPPRLKSPAGADARG
jgi:invasion protein IalB